MTVYIDELAAVNLLLDYFLLRGAAMISGRKIRRWRLISGAAAGAAYAVLCCLPGADFLSWLPVRAAVGVGMCAAAFGAGRKILRPTGWFFALSAAMAGGVRMLSYFGGDRISMISGAVYVRVPVPWLLTASCAVWLGLTMLLRLPGLAAAVGCEKRRAVIVCGDRRREADVLTDTGCMLRDPCDNARVLVVSPELAEELLPPEYGEAMRRGDTPEELVLLGGEVCPRLIHASGVSGVGLLFCFRASEVNLGGEKLGKMTVAVSPSLGENGTDAIIGLR